MMAVGPERAKCVTAVNTEAAPRWGWGCPQRDGTCLEGRIDGLQQLTGVRGEGQEVAWTDRSGGKTRISSAGGWRGGPGGGARPRCREGAGQVQRRGEACGPLTRESKELGGRGTWGPWVKEEGVWYRKLKDSWSAEPQGTCVQRWLWAKRRGGRWVPSSSQATPPLVPGGPLAWKRAPQGWLWAGASSKEVEGSVRDVPQAGRRVCFLEALPACANTPEPQL